ncbi:radial spoke head 1 homolog [Clytia hemisphaerica]|uniref:Uncharacterized protein n=1 Tax=Clytia hemisphaerica TaxID=252671 RepID=A0A7M5XE14_9CNID|eukprot:TCONS_00055457-protein
MADESISDYDLDDGRDGDIGVYEGERNELGERHGLGTSHFPNGDVYEGSYEHGRRNGYGIYRFKNGKYEGIYVNGKRGGRGFMHYPDGSTYDGEWADNDKNGTGTYTYRNGDIYEGGWKDDQKNGKGVYTYKDSGTKLYGYWSEGVREGPAEWYNTGHSFKGYFRNDNPLGRGKFSFDSGCEQHGFYRVTNLVEQVDNRHVEVVGQETRWTCTSLTAAPPKVTL